MSAWKVNPAIIEKAKRAAAALPVLALELLLLLLAVIC